MLFYIACYENRSVMTILLWYFQKIRYVLLLSRRANVGAYIDTYHLSVADLRIKYCFDTLLIEFQNININNKKI